jgi:hypothetical protein
MSSLVEEWRKVYDFSNTDAALEMKYDDDGMVTLSPLPSLTREQQSNLIEMGLDPSKPQAELRPYDPTMREKARALISDFLADELDVDPKRARYVSEKLMGVENPLSGLGIGLFDLIGATDLAGMGVEEGLRQAERGIASDDALETIMGGAGAALSAIPGAAVAAKSGKVISKAVKKTPAQQAPAQQPPAQQAPAQQPPAQQGTPIEPRGPAVKLTPAENKFFASFMENKANREELMEEVPSLRIDNGTISVDQKGVDELIRWIDETVVRDGAGKVPPRLKKAKFYNMLDGEAVKKAPGNAPLKGGE